MWGGGGKPKRIRFVVSAAVGSFLMEKKIHRSQVAQRRGDGSVEVALEIAMGPPLVSYLCSLAGEVSEIEPAELAKQVRERHRRAIELR